MPSKPPKVGSTYYFRRVIPEDLRPYFQTKNGKPRVEFMISLGVKDLSLAKQKWLVEAVRIDAQIQEARKRKDAGIPPKRDRSATYDAYELSDREYREEQADQSAEEFLAYEGREPQRKALRDAILSYRGRETPPEIAVLADMIDEQELLSDEEQDRLARARQRSWDQGAREVAERVAKLGVEGAFKPASEASEASIRKQFNAYVAERQPEPATIKSWTRVVENLVAFLKHDDITQVRSKDLVDWKDHLLREKKADGARARQPQTVRDTYVAAAKVIFEYAVAQRAIPENPADGLQVLSPKRKRLRETKGFTPQEAGIILQATLDAPPPRLSPHSAMARRWVPWLCAYTGARVNEITQLRAEDVREVDGDWAILITPEAGTVKTGQARSVPLHPHLLEQGFPAFAKGKKGPLFYNPSAGRGGSAANPHYKKVGERLAAWVREIGVADPEVAPNHGWRHLFKSLSRQAGFADGAADAVQGHSPSTEGAKYGDWPMKALAAEIAKLPRFKAQKIEHGS